DRAPMWGVLADALSRHLPEQRDKLHLSFALADAERLERLLERAAFQHVRVRRETRSATFESFGAYWAPIEAGTGQMPQAYLSLPGPARRAVRDEVRRRLAEFESGGRLVMTVEGLIGTGWAEGLAWYQLSPGPASRPLPVRPGGGLELLTMNCEFLMELSFRRGRSSILAPGWIELPLAARGRLRNHHEPRKVVRKLQARQGLPGRH